MTLAAALAVEEVALDELRPDPANPRRISDDELEALTRSLRRFGFVQPKLRLIGAVPAGWGHDLVGPAAVS